MNRLNELNPNAADQAEQHRVSTSLRSGKSPFKAGSLEASPRDRAPASPQQPFAPPKPPPFFATVHANLYRNTSEQDLLQQTASEKGEIRATSKPDYDPKKRTSLNTLSQQALRAPSSHNETAIASSGSSSPSAAPIHKYASSFNRPPRAPQGSGRSGESGGSSSKGSHTHTGPDNSLRGSDPPAADTDEGIAHYLALFDAPAVKNHHLLRAASASSASSSSQPRHAIDLAKYSKLIDPSEKLAEEMGASSLIQASSTPPSRRLSNVPGLSISSSPSRALAHAPHVRSRLSTHSIAEERAGSDSSQRVAEDEEDEDEPFIFPMA